MENIDLSKITYNNGIRGINYLVEDLRRLLRQRGLVTSGNKRELIDRLLEYENIESSEIRKIIEYRYSKEEVVDNDKVFNLGEIIDDKYVIINFLGNGSYGDVFKVKNIYTNKEYALKISNKKKRLKNEIEILKKLNGVEGVIKMYDYGEYEDHSYLVTKVYPGDVFNTADSKKCILEDDEIDKLGINVIKILEKIHDHGIVHRDIKPENILIKYKDYPYDDVIIIDFGLSDKFKYGVRKYRGKKGTPKYTSLRNIKGDPKPIDDLESLAYSLIYLKLKCYLPWSNLDKEKYDINNYNEKRKMLINVGLCKNISKKYCKFLDEILLMDPNVRPDYKKLLNILNS